MRPSEVYQYGLSVAASATSEPEQRAAIGRIYYGSHHEVCGRYFRAVPHEQPLSKNRRHRELVDRLNDPSDPHLSTISNLLFQLMEMRGEADYELIPPLRFRGRPISSTNLMNRSVATAGTLWDELELRFPGTATGTECKVAYTA